MMKYLVILVLALFAMAAAQGVNVVDNNNPGNVNFVDNNNPGNVNVYNPPPGGEPVDISPVYVNRPGKQYSNPLFRGGSGRR